MASFNSADVIAYIIYKYESGFGLLLIQSMVLLILKILIYCCNVAEQYRVAALDSCGNTSPLSNAIETINVTINLSICDNIFSLSWNHPKEFYI